MVITNRIYDQQKKTIDYDEIKLYYPLGGVY